MKAKGPAQTATGLSLRTRISIVLILYTILCAMPAWTQDLKPGAPGYQPPSPVVRIAASGHNGDSPFEPPKTNDTTFLVDTGSGLDTGCTYRGDGPLEFTIKITRVIGDKDKLKQNGLISATALLQMPAYDVDSEAVVSGFNPERETRSISMANWFKRGT